MAEIKLYKSPWKALRLFGLSSIFVIPSLWLLLTGRDSSASLWFGLCFFGSGYIISLFHLFDRRPQIIINRIGIHDITNKQGLIQWEIVQDAYELNIYNQYFIALELDKSFTPKKNLYKWAAKLNKSVGGQDVNLNLGQIKTNKHQLITLIKMLPKEEIDNRDKLIKTYQKRLNAS